MKFSEYIRMNSQLDFYFFNTSNKCMLSKKEKNQNPNTEVKFMLDLPFKINVYLVA